MAKNSKIRMSRLYHGMRVRLSADVIEGWPEQTGVILGFKSPFRTIGSPILIQLDEAEDPEGDRLREVTIDQVEAIVWPSA